VGLLIIKVQFKKTLQPHLRLILFQRTKEKKIAFSFSFSSFYTSPLLKWEDISFPSFHLGHISTFIFVTDNSYSYYYPKWKRKKNKPKKEKKEKKKIAPLFPLFSLFKISFFFSFSPSKWILTFFPFDILKKLFIIPSLLLWYLTNLLGSTNPERNTLLQEPLSASAENYICSQFSSCYYHQDLH